MNGEFDELTQKRRKWVEANQENGFDEGIKRLLTDLYPDNAHFIYELLQNAEDAGATTVEFKLDDSRLEFGHDGKRLFSLTDVDSITSIGVSTKRNDPTSIGKFGVGFKAVFAYTNTPEVHSGDYHFRIDDLVVPTAIGMQATAGLELATRFSFPFNNPNKQIKQARNEIEAGLIRLGDNTLLFLRHIHCIRYVLPNSGHGLLFREDGIGGEITIVNRSPSDDTQSHWLRYEKEVAVIDEDGITKTCRIGIAYLLAEEEDKNLNPCSLAAPG